MTRHRCPICHTRKVRSLFPKGHTSMCLACTRVDSSARRGAIVHNVHRYKVYACRCAVCREAMSAYMKARYVPVVKIVPAPSSSFWLGLKPEGFTAYIEREQAQRLKGSRFGQLYGRPYTTDEVSR